MSATPVPVAFRPGVIARGAETVAGWAALLDDATPPYVRDRIAVAPGDPQAFDGPEATTEQHEQRDQILNATVATLGQAHTVIEVVELASEPARRWHATFLLGGTAAVQLDRPAPDVLYLSAPHPSRLLDEQLLSRFDVSEPGADSVAEAPSTLLIDQASLAVLQTVFRGRDRVDRDAFATALAPMLLPDSSARSVAEELIEANLVDEQDDELQIAPGPVFAAVASGAGLEIRREAIPATGNETFDSASLVFIGPPEARYIVLPHPFDSTLVAVVPVGDRDQLDRAMEHLLHARTEPAWLPVAGRPDDVPEPLEHGVAQAISASTLLELRSPLNAALRMPKATIVVRREGWPHGWSDGFAFAGPTAVAWTWRDGHGWAQPTAPERVPAMLRSLAVEHLEDPSAGGIGIQASRGDRHGLDIGACDIRHEPSGWVVVARNGTPTEPTVPVDPDEVVARIWDEARLDLLLG